MPRMLFPVVIKERTFLEIVRPIGDSHWVAGLAVAFNGVLIDRGIDHSQIVQNTAGLGAFARAQKAWDSNGCQQSDNGHHDHDFDESESFVRLCRESIHIEKYRDSSRHASISMIDMLPDATLYLIAR